MPLVGWGIAIDKKAESPFKKGQTPELNANAGRKPQAPCHMPGPYIYKRACA
jgi:hypothetical protein